MFRLFTNYTFVLALVFCTFLLSYGQNMHWGNVGIVAGGFVTGIIYHPAEQGLAYARTDMGGAYRLDPASKVWQPISDQFSSDDWNMFGVESMAIDPTDAS